MYRLRFPIPSLSSFLALLFILSLVGPMPASAQADDPFAGDVPAEETPEALDEPRILDLEELLGPLLEEPSFPPSEGPPSSADPEPHAPPPPPPTAPRIPEDHIERAAESFEATGEAAVVGLPTGQVHPFGQAVPEIVCLPYRACDLELEAGETLDGLVLGDPQRWSSEFLFEGAADAPIPHIVVKPAEYGLRTNAVVVTSRRTYHLELRSPERDEDEPTTYHHHVAWWYPEDWVRRSREAQAQAVREARPVTSPIEQALDLEQLNFGYRIEEPRRARRRLPWQPVTVFDDGTRTYLKLPAVSRRGDLPALLGQLEDGSLFPLEARLAEDWWIVPEVLERLQLVLGSGKTKKSLTLVNEGAREAGR